MRCFLRGYLLVQENIMARCASHPDLYGKHYEPGVFCVFLIDFCQCMQYYHQSMYELMVESKFSAAHQLRGYKGKCEKLHGHNWRVTMAVTAERLDEQGIAIDFHDLKKFLREVLDQLEHTCLNEIFPFTQINPTSENVAKWIYDNMAKKVNDDNIEVASVTVWESDTASASYFE